MKMKNETENGYSGRDIVNQSFKIFSEQYIRRIKGDKQTCELYQSVSSAESEEIRKIEEEVFPSDTLNEERQSCMTSTFEKRLTEIVEKYIVTEVFLYSAHPQKIRGFLLVAFMVFNDITKAEKSGRVSFAKELLNILEYLLILGRAGVIICSQKLINS